MEARPEGVQLTTPAEVNVIMPHTGRSKGKGDQPWGELPIVLTHSEAAAAFNHLDNLARSETFRACEYTTAEETTRYYRDLTHDLGFYMLHSARMQPDPSSRPSVRLHAA
jgi:hypothetical protein